MNKKLVHLVFAALFLFTAIFVPSLQANAIAAGVTQKITPISGGMFHSVALKDDGSLWAWGANQRFQIGHEDNTLVQPTPEPVDDGYGSFVSIAAGSDFSLALRFDGGVYALGGGGSSPVYRVPDLAGIVAIAAGQDDGLALDKEGGLWQWTVGNRPRRVAQVDGVAAIAAGGFHFFALTHSGEVWAWGYNGNGQLGNGTTADVSEPRRINTLANIVYITAGYSHSLAISKDGSVYAWGTNSYGQLGDGTTEERHTPVKVSGVNNADLVSAGQNTSMLLTKDGEIYTWGYGEYGQLGNGTTTVVENKPIKIEVEGTPIHISSGFFHNFYVTDEGELYTWGRNNSSQLGIADSEKSSQEPEPIKILDSIDNEEDGQYSTDPLGGSSSWALEELNKLYSLELLPPMLWGRYRQNTTRAEFAGVLVNLYETVKKKTITYPSTSNFEDIDNHAYETEIRKAYEIELVAGVSETRFNPEGNITREEAAKMICTFICIMEDFPLPSRLVSLTYYKDASMVQDWAVLFEAYAHKHKIMLGDPDGNFKPRDNLTREQTLLMVYRTILKYYWA